MWQQLHSQFPQQVPSSKFQRGQISVSPGSKIGIINYGSGRIRAEETGWFEPAIYQPQIHKNLISLGTWQGLPLFIRRAAFGQARAENWPSVRSWLLQSNQDEFDVLATAAGVAKWWNQNKFCGRCGTPTLTRNDEYARECPQCKMRHYPRVAPCIITLVWKEDALLLARSPRFAPGVYSTLAGFIETGESAEQALHREVAEEVSVKIGNLRYLGSQAWPFPHSLMLGYWAEFQGGDIKIDGVEIEDANWYAFDNLPELPPKTSIARYLIDSFLQWKGIRK